MHRMVRLYFVLASGLHVLLSLFSLYFPLFFCANTGLTSGCLANGVRGH